MEIAHRGLTDLHVIDTMHERKNMMYDIADGFIIMPGGLGTLDETMEIITWRQLGLHRKPIIIANLYGYWDHMLLLFQNIIDEGFMHHGHTGHFEHVDDMDELADRLDSYFPASHAAGYPNLAILARSVKPIAKHAISNTGNSRLSTLANDPVKGGAWPHNFCNQIRIWPVIST